MSIAQHSVAGEGEAYPLDSESNALNAQLEELELGRNLPYATLRAHQRALNLTTLPKRARAALASIALVVDARKPLNSVFARRSYLSRRAGLSERTWYRAEQDLVDAGLVTVSEQIRKPRGGLFGAAYIHLSEQAARALGLIAMKKVVAEAPTEQPDLAAGADASSLPAQPTAKVSDRFTYKDYLFPPSQRRQPGQLPEDVQPLLAVGFRKYFIFWLMGIARRNHGKQLGHVVTASWEMIKKARNPVAYVFALLRSSTDFAWLAKQRHAAKIEAQDAAERQAAAEAERERIAGQRFVAIDGAKRFEVSTDGSSLTVESITESAVRTAGGHWIDDFVAALRAGKIRLAVHADHASFEAARECHLQAQLHEQVREAQLSRAAAIGVTSSGADASSQSTDLRSAERSWELSSLGHTTLGGLRSLLVKAHRSAAA
ncbi:helix-turn-helix domain-containing protein [Burkholderia arboris]|uniref:helix-turn-helix domain-containing protein n=1 Tax=Burkholderia arboris TaxID=488730 RepID=UPI001CF3A05B|nr:helix-turn-helix domain-containing protein [Burkholderia arboris]MCA8050666.1 helix-turn-helix domain-containing protein [Burkholderia arboris]